MEIEELLRRVSMAPLGPLAMTSASTGSGAWTLTASVAGKAHTIQAELDSVSGGLVLATAVEDGSATLAAGWVTDTKVDQGSGKIVRRLWLHGEGLTPALLLNAVAALAAVAVADEPVVELPTIVIPEPPREPDPVPLERPRPVGWNSFGFGFGRSDTEEPELETPVVESVEAEAAPPSEPEAAPAEAPVAVTASADVSDGANVTTEATEAAPASVIEVAPATEEFLPSGKSGNCRECGSPYTPEHAFCTNCGARLN